MKKKRKIGIVLHLKNLFNIWFNSRQPDSHCFSKYMREI